MPAKIPVVYPFVYASEQQQGEMFAQLVGVATHHIAVSVSPGSKEGIPIVIVSKDPDTVTVTVPAKKEGEITFVPYNGTISLEVPTGMYATVVLTLKDGRLSGAAVHVLYCRARGTWCGPFTRPTVEALYQSFLVIAEDRTVGRSIAQHVATDHPGTLQPCFYIPERN